MKTIIIYYSVHHGNTKKVAEGLSEHLNYDTIPIGNASTIDLGAYDAVIIASGVYASSIPKEIKNYIVENSEELRQKRIGVILTSGILSERFMKSAETVFNNVGISVDAKFQCKGYDTFGPLSLIKGINKGRPNDEDIKNAIEAFKDF